MASARGLSVNPQWPFRIHAPLESDRLAVSARHTIYFERHGNSEAIPAVVLHGGPGAASSPLAAGFFDLNLYHVVLFDQRGCGRSTPHGCMDENTIWHLISDIEA